MYTSLLLLLLSKLSLINIASHSDDGFEIIDAPSSDMTATSTKHGIATCGNPSCQLSHVSRKDELASNRAIEPLIVVMQGTVVDLETKGRILRAKIGSATDRNVIFDTFVGALLIEWRRVTNRNACKQFLQQYGALCVVGGRWWSDSFGVPYQHDVCSTILRTIGSGCGRAVCGQVGWRRVQAPEGTIPYSGFPDKG